METSHHSINDYDLAQADLLQTPNDKDLQYNVVLALARAGSLGFAMAQYRRFGLGNIRTHADVNILEDMIALGGRLFKDKAMRESGDTRRKLAMQSAKQYRLAHKLTGGYFSGINEATMSLLAGQSSETVRKKARKVLNDLPNIESRFVTEGYFIEATRAEAYLLMGKIRAAGETLTHAGNYDPLNYTAHASTLKQFRMILRARNEPLAWTEPFRPPKTAHYAGHIFSLKQVENPQKLWMEKLEFEFSDIIQQNDIGFGYGALAAGADILFAEALLRNGARIHVVLPASKDIFMRGSVTPFGKPWEKRFLTCLESATSVLYLGNAETWPNGPAANYASNIAMGLASAHAGSLCTSATQLLFWDKKNTGKNVGTSRDGCKWRATGRSQVIIPDTRAENDIARISTSEMGGSTRSSEITICVTANSKVATLAQETVKAFVFKHKQAGKFSQTEDGLSARFDDETLAAVFALTLMENCENADESSSIKIGAHYGLSNGDTHNNMAQDLARHCVPGTILISGAYAAILSGFHEHKFQTEYMGRSLLGSKGELSRVFSLLPPLASQIA